MSNTVDPDEGYDEEYDDDDFEDDETEGSGSRRRLILIGLVVLLLLCLVFVAGYRLYGPASNQDVADDGEPPTTTAAATETPPAEASPEATATATQVVPETADDASETQAETESQQSSTDTDAGTSTETEDETDDTAAEEDDDNGEIAQPAATSTRVPGAADTTVSRSVEVIEVFTIDELLSNGDFEDGFAETGVGLHWESFRTDGADINFSAETHDALIHDGAQAQRISVENAQQADRYAGIFQTVEVLPNEVYTLTLYGQIRSGYGSVEASSYGYRVEVAFEPTGGQDWQAIPTTGWIEIPWDEQPLDAVDVTYSPYTTQFTSTSESLTLFVRTWNKWADPALAEYSLDSLSLVGLVPGEPILVEVITTSPDDTAAAFTPGGGSSEAADDSEVLLDQPLPVTGFGNAYSMVGDGRFWGATVVLVLLAVGAIYRGKWG